MAELGVSIHWTGRVDWTTVLEYWTLFRVKNKFNMSIFIIVVNIMQQKISLFISD